MISRIVKFIKDHPSYFRRSVSSLAKRFKCSESVIRRVLDQLVEEKKLYNQSFKKNKKYE